ncbi:hypothetical protein [Arcanobacterium canis]
MILEAIVEILLDILSTALPEKWRRALRAASATDMRGAETRVRGGLAHAKFPSDLPTPITAESATQLSKTTKKERKEEPNFVLLGSRDQWFYGLPIVRVDAATLPNERTMELPALGEQFNGRFVVLLDHPLKGKGTWMKMAGKQLKKADAERLPTL